MGAPNQTLAPFPCTDPATQSRETKNQSHAVSSPLKPVQPELAVTPGAFSIHCSNQVTCANLTKDSGSNEGGILDIAKVHLQCQEVSILSQNTYVYNGLRSDQNPTHFTVSATTLICTFQEGNHQINYKKNECFV